MARSLALATYLSATRALAPLFERKIEQRRAAGKEDPDRITERYGQPRIPRPAGGLLWFHAASVGESLSILELIRQIHSEFATLSLLVTTGTRTSAQLLAVRLPAGVIHQYVPIDTPQAVVGFLDHWRPDVALWTESELWPRLLLETEKRAIPMLLINGRVSQKSADRWRYLPAMSKRLLAAFEGILVQDDAIGDRFKSMGAPVDRLHVTGSLKEGAQALPADETLRKAYAEALAGRRLWLAASTHAGEEEAVLSAHAALRKRHADLMLLLAPRHPERGDEVAALLEEAGLTFTRRSAGEAPNPGKAVYLADTLGEMGLWYRLSPISFVGGSLAEVGGHNPFEPAALGSAIVHGPHVTNFADIYARLQQAGGAIETPDAQGLAEAIAACLSPERVAQLATAAWEVSSGGAGVTDVVMAHLRPYLTAASTAP